MTSITKSTANLVEAANNAASRLEWGRVGRRASPVEIQTAKSTLHLLRDAAPSVAPSQKEALTRAIDRLAHALHEAGVTQTASADNHGHDPVNNSVNNGGSGGGKVPGGR